MTKLLRTYISIYDKFIGYKLKLCTVVTSVTDIFLMYIYYENTFL
jgi:hypothetical protein